MLEAKNHPARLIYRNLCLLGVSLSVIGCSQPKTEDTQIKQTAPAVTETEKTSSQSVHENETLAIEKETAPVRSAESHVHGGATLSIVSENDTISIEFETPLYNLLGFEYAPRNSDEKALIEEVETTLTQPETLISFNKGAKCNFAEMDQSVELFDHASGADDAHDEDHDDHAEDHHDEDNHDEDHDEHTDHHEEEDAGSHKGLIVNYALTCQKIENLKTISVEFFEIFPNLADLDLVYLGPSQQMSAELSPSKATADLTR